MRTLPLPVSAHHTCCHGMAHLLLASQLSGPCHSAELLGPLCVVQFTNCVELKYPLWPHSLLLTVVWAGGVLGFS